MKARVLDKFMSGEETMCFAMSEPDAGSDAWAMSTRASRQGDGWVLNGVKQWITNSPWAQYALVFAVTNEQLRASRKGGITCFLVPTDSVGYQIDSVISLFGDVGGNESIISLNDVYVSAESAVGEVDEGFALAVGGVALGRLYNAGRCVGLARWALERATEYAKERKTFGKAISEYQGISFQLADSAMEIYATKTMSMDCAQRLERGEEASRELAMVKAYSTEMCFRVYDRCIQVHGGMGLTNEMRLYDGWHLARIIRIADGSGEIMRRNIARALFRGETDF
jgi:acyl-CoA dehydrogenase